MKRLPIFAVLLVFCLLTSPLEAQNKKLRKAAKDAGKELYTPSSGKQKRQGPQVSPIRKVLNMFNFHVELAPSSFTHSNTFNDLILVRTDNPESWIYAARSAEAGSGAPFTALTNWFNTNRPVVFDQIYDEDLAISTDTLSLKWTNQGATTPVNLRVSFSIKKLDKLHYKTTGERRTLDQDFIRIGGGISMSKVKYKNNFFTTEDEPNYGNLLIPVTETRMKRVFGTVDVNVWNYVDYTLFVSVMAGTWEYKVEDFNSDYVTYDPFYSIGVTLEKQFSKYFKVYLRPSVEFRNYNFMAEEIMVPNKITSFNLNLGFIIKYPTYPRNRFKPHQVQMEHVFNGKLYRGRSIFRRQNPRIGQNFRQRKKH